MVNLRKIGLTGMLTLALAGNLQADYRESRREYNNPDYTVNNYSDFRTGYDPNLSKPKATDSLNLSGAIPLGILTAGFLTLLALGFRSNNKEFRRDSGRDN
jgi:hypothetical protein